MTPVGRGSGQIAQVQVESGQFDGQLFAGHGLGKFLEKFLPAFVHDGLISAVGSAKTGSRR